MSMDLIKDLRERTGAGMLDCKKALTETNNNVEEAVNWLRAKGISKAAKKSGRSATEGTITSYIHAGGKIGVLLEVNIETDFAAKNENFELLCREICMHIAAVGPEYVTREEIPAAVIEKEREIQKARIIEEGKPAHMADKIVDGRVNKYFEELVLMDQKFVKDDSKTVKELVAEGIAKIGENIQVRRFARFVLGEGLEKKTNDFAAEVAATAAGVK